MDFLKLFKSIGYSIGILGSIILLTIFLTALLDIFVFLNEEEEEIWSKRIVLISSVFVLIVCLFYFFK